MFGSGVSYELICFSAFIVTTISIGRLCIKGEKGGERLLSVLLVGLFFAFGWEPQGTGLVWRYPGYVVYTFMEIPLALLLSWSWWMVACRLLADFIEKGLNRIFRGMGQYASTVAVYFSGVLVALIVEPLSVSMDWWDYLVVGDKAVLYFPLLGVGFNLTVIVGWGLLTVLNLALSDLTISMASRQEGTSLIHRLLTLGYVCAVLGVFNGWFSWQIVGFFAAFVEGAVPRLFFTRYYIYILEGVNAGLLIGLLLATSLLGYFLLLRSSKDCRSTP
jgi:hypothetical protein